MCQIKAVVVTISILLQVGASFCIYQAHTEKKRDTIGKSKVKFPAKTTTRSIV